MDREQLFFPIKGIDRIEESPRLEACKDAKDSWERFIAYRFALQPDDETYQRLFPFLKDLDLDAVDGKTLESLTDFFTEAEDKIRLYIEMASHWNTYTLGEQQAALMEWIEWSDMFESIQSVETLSV